MFPLKNSPIYDICLSSIPVCHFPSSLQINLLLKWFQYHLDIHCLLGGVTSLDANGVDKVRAIEQKVQGEFAVFLTENDPMKNDPKITPKTFGLRVSTRALKLLGLVNGLRRIHSDDIGRVFFKGESGPNVYSCHFKGNIFAMSESDFVGKISGLRNNIGCGVEDHFGAYDYGYALNEKLSSIVELKTEPG